MSVLSENHIHYACAPYLCLYLPTSALHPTPLSPLQVPSVPCVNGVRYGADLGCFRRPGDVLDLSQLVGVTADDATYIVIPSKVGLVNIVLLRSG